MHPLTSIQCHHNCQFPKQTEEILISKYSKKHCLLNIINCYLLPKTLHKDKRQQAIQTGFQCQGFTHSLFSISSVGLDVNKADKVKNKTVLRTVVLFKIPKGVCHTSFSRLLPPNPLKHPLALTHPTLIFRRINPLFFF